MTEKIERIQEGYQPQSQPAGGSDLQKGFQPQASGKPEGQNPPSGGSSVMPPANTQSSKKE